LYGPGGTGLGACFDDVYEMNPRTFKPFQLKLLPIVYPVYLFCKCPWLLV
jgi:hypothetical protein